MTYDDWKTTDPRDAKLSECEDDEGDWFASIERMRVERTRAAAEKLHAEQREMEAAFGPFDPNYLPF